MATNYETHEYDVLVIGAGGAGLRAAIEASAAGVKVGLICKSLLGKAHTVMAEGGMAAAMGNVDDRDRIGKRSFRRHDARRAICQQLAHASRKLHAKEAPSRASTNSKLGEQCSTARRKARFRSAISAATAIRASRMSATARDWR